jgi:lysophospholipase L1-like esterase
VASVACGSDATTGGSADSGAFEDAPSASDVASDSVDAFGDGEASVGETVEGGDAAAKDAGEKPDVAEASVTDGKASTDVTDAGGDSTDASGFVETIHYYGRWNRLADRAITVNSGSHLVAQFDGTSIAARFDVTTNVTPFPNVAWRIDQGAWQEAEIASSLSLASGLSAGLHEVWLIARGFDENESRWTPPLVSSLTFLAFDVTGGSLRASARPVQPKIEFLGDSITEGVAIYPDRAGKTGPAWRADGRIAYACQTSLALGADWRQVGFGRQGVTIVGNGGVPKAGDAFNWIYANVPRDAWQPDLVVINQGTNDASAAADVFRQAYSGFLDSVRKAYAQAWIAALRPFGGAHAADIQAEVASRAAAGDARIFFVDTTGWLSAPDFTDGVHPNAQGSAKVTQLLTPVLQTHLK